MGIGPAEAEGINTGQDAAGRKWLQISRHPQLQFLELDGRIRCDKVQMRRDHPVPQHQRHLDQARDAGSGLEMSNVRFDRANYALVAIGAFTA